MADQKLSVEISVASILKIVMTVLFFILLYLLKNIIIIMLFAIVLASAISPSATWLQSRGVPRILGVLLLYILLFSMLALVLSMIVPFISQDLSQLTSVFPKIVEKVSSSLDNVQKGSPQYFDFVSEIQNMLDGVSNYLQQFSQSTVSLIVSVFGGVFSFFAILVISFYLSVMKNGIQVFLASVLPERYEDYAIDLWARSERKMGRWLQGQALLALVVGLIVYVGLSLMGIRFALVLGILAMVLEIVPVAGPVLAAIPAVFLGFLQNPTLGIWVIVFYTVVQQMENHILVPLILGKTTGLNPVVVILALMIGGHLAGVAGAILGVPIATILVEVFDDMVKQKESRRSTA